LLIVVLLLWLLQPKTGNTSQSQNGGKSQTATGAVPGLQIVREIIAPDAEFANNNQLFCSTTNVTNQTGGTYAASNGITLSQTTFKLGGSLTENTTIAGGGKNVTFSSTGGAY